MPRSNLCPEPAPLAPTTWATDQGAGVTVQTASGLPRSRVAQVAASGGFVYSAPAAVTPGQTYIGSVYTRRVGGVNGRLYLAFLNGDLSYNFGSPAPMNITFTGNTVQRWDQSGTAPVGAAYLQVWVEYFVFGGDTLETSCALIEDGSTLGSYEDGDSAGWEWDGTAGHSASSESTAIPLTHTDTPASVTTGGPSETLQLGLTLASTAQAVRPSGQSEVLQLGLGLADTAAAVTLGGPAGQVALGLTHADQATAVRLVSPAGALLIGADLTLADTATAARATAITDTVALSPAYSWPPRARSITVRRVAHGTVSIR